MLRSTAALVIRAGFLVIPVPLDARDCLLVGAREGHGVRSFDRPLTRLFECSRQLPRHRLRPVCSWSWYRTRCHRFGSLLARGWHDRDSRLKATVTTCTKGEAMRWNVRGHAKRAEAHAGPDSPEGTHHQQALPQKEESGKSHALTSTGPVLVTRVVPYEHFSNANVYVRGNRSLLPENPLTTVSLSLPGFEHVVPGNVVSFDLEVKRPIAVHLIERGDDRAYRASVSDCGIDLVNGGAFTLAAPGHPDLRVPVPSDMAMRFMTLRNRDVVQVVLGADAKKVEAFWHLARANGADPRNPCNFPEGF